MKIVVIGATGDIGRAVVSELSPRHEVIEVSRTRAALTADIRDPPSLEALFDRVGTVDAIVSTAGDAHFGPLATMTDAQFQIGLSHKLMGQVRLALMAQSRLANGGSITLTTGILSEAPIRYGANAATANAAIEGFVRAAAIELPRGLRINAVSPTVLVESLDRYAPYFRGFEAAPASRVALAYARSVEGAETGRTYRVH